MPEAPATILGENRRITTILPEVMVQHQIFFHGSNIANITRLNPSEEVTIGNGVYLTSDEQAARGYAERRARRDPESTPHIYRAEIHNLRLADLRTRQGVNQFAELLKRELLEELKKSGLSATRFNVIHEILLE